MEFIIKLVIDNFMFKYFFSKMFNTVIPPEEKFCLNIKPFVIPQMVPAIIDKIIGGKNNGGILVVSFIQNGYISEEAIIEQVVFLGKKRKLINKAIKFIISIIVDGEYLVILVIIIASP